MDAHKNFRKNILSNAGATAVGLAVQLLLITLLARILPIKVFAGYLTAAAIIAIAEIFSDFGTRIWATQSFAIEDDADRVLWLSLSNKLFYTTICAVALLIFGIKLLSLIDLILVVLIASTQPGTDPLMWFLRGKARLDIEAVVELSWRIIFALSLGALAAYGVGLTALLVGWLTCNVIRIVVCSRLPIVSELDFAGLFKATHVSEMGNLIKRTFPIGAAFLIMTLYQRLSILILKAVQRPTDVTAFGVAFTLVASSSFISTSITISAFPRLAQALDSHNMEDFSLILREKLRLISLVMVPLCFLGILFLPLAIILFFGRGYESSKLVAVILMPGLYISSISFALKYVLNVLGLNWFDFTSVCFGIIVLVAVLLLPLPLPLAQRAALAWSAGELMIFFFKWATIRRYSSVKKIPLSRALAINFFLWIVAVVVYSQMNNSL